jgi:hypothetical protein
MDVYYGTHGKQQEVGTDRLFANQDHDKEKGKAQAIIQAKRLRHNDRREKDEDRK